MKRLLAHLARRIGRAYSAESFFASLEALTILLMLWLGVYLGAGLVNSETREETTKILQAISDNWRTSFLVLIPLFFRSISLFLKEVTEIWGIKRKPATPQAMPLEEPIPPDDPMSSDTPPQ